MKNPLIWPLRQAFLAATRSSNTSVFPSRRAFIRQSAQLGMGAFLLQSPGLKWIGTQAPRVSIIGSGIAGMNTAYQLQKNGIASTIYEASSRVGGRMMSVKNIMGPGLTTDIGGEFVDGNHEDILGLLKDFQLPYYDLRTNKSQKSVLFFNGKKREYREIEKTIKKLLPKLKADAANLPADLNNLSYQNADAWRYLDQQSITDYVQKIGMTGWVKKYFNASLSSLYTMNAAEQSAINLFLLLGTFTAEEEEEKEDQSEIFKIIGGSQTLTDALGEKLAPSTQLNHELLEIHLTAHGTYSLVFKTAKHTLNVETDYLVLALPFTILRNIKTVGFEWPPVKKRAIQEMGYGNGGKCILGVKERVWAKQGGSGGLQTDLAVGGGWDSSRLQPYDNGSFTVFGGGHQGVMIQQQEKEDLVKNFVPDLNHAFPGFQQAFNNKVFKFSWQNYPHNLGSYSSYTVGQWSAFGGAEAEPVDKIFFAGEHCDIEFQGYMNGGARSGRRAAENLAKLIK
jgi:monoamine oxidase